MAERRFITLRLTSDEAAALARFRKGSKKRGKMVTTQKILVLVSFLRVGDRATVEAVRKSASAKIPNIGYSTVLRALSLFVELGLARRTGRLPFLFSPRK